MDYLRIYTQIVERGQTRKPIEGEYYERHHIIPQCVVKDDSPENLSTLTAREHFIAHWILTRIYPEHRGITYAFLMMCNTKNQKRNYVISARAYSEAKEQASKHRIIFYSNKENRDFQSITMKKVWERPEHREKIIKKLLAFRNTDEYKKSVSVISKERWSNPEYKKMMSDRMRENFGSEENRKKISERTKNYWDNSVDRKEKMSEWSKKMWEENGRKEKMSEWSKKMWEENKEKMNSIFSSIEYRKKISKYTDEKIKEVKDMIYEGISAKKVSENTGIPIRIIYRIKSGEIYEWVK